MEKYTPGGRSIPAGVVVIHRRMDIHFVSGVLIPAFFRHFSEQLYRADGDSPLSHGRKPSGTPGKECRPSNHGVSIPETRRCTVDLDSSSSLKGSGSLMVKADIFCLAGPDGALLPPAVQATVLAKYSRSAESARDMLSGLSEADADRFQEKWVGQYGHSSVAELANVPVCFEGISIVASKFVESWQRAGYSEKSTRYQVFSRDSFVTPPGAPATMEEFSARLYAAYDGLLPKVTRLCAEKMGEDPDAPEPKRTVRARAFDNVRYLLPAGTGTNVAAVLNMRDARDMAASLAGHANPEFQAIGAGLLSAVSEVCPALVRHAGPNAFRLPFRTAGPTAPGFDPSVPGPYVRIDREHLMPGRDMEQAAFESLLSGRYGTSWEAFCKLMEGRPGHAEVPEPFKTVRISFEVMMDYGAFRDLQRHRRCEQYVEPLRTDYGYVVPDDVAGTDLEGEYREAMECVEAYDDDAVVHDQDLMQYMIPLGYLHRSVFQMDLRELYYIVELRTKPQGHISYRRIAYEMFRLASERMPKLMQWCRAVRPDEIGEHR